MEKLFYSKSRKILSILLSIIISMSTFFTLLFDNVLLSDWIDLKSAFTANAATTGVNVYRYGNLIGLYNLDYADDTAIQYKIGENGTWTNYVRPFSIEPFAATKVYKRLGTDGQASYANLTTDTLAMGAYTQSDTDLELTNHGVTFGYTRTYNSKNNSWFESTDSRVYLYSAGLARIYFPDGTMCQLPRISENVYKDEVTRRTLTKDTESGFYVYKDGTYIYKFKITSNETTAYLNKLSDNNGNTITISRSSGGITVSDGEGRSFVAPYITSANSADSMHTFTGKDVNGNTVTYTAKDSVFYSVEDPAATVSNQYTYATDSNGAVRLKKTIDKTISYYVNGRVSKVTNKDGSYTTYGYSNAERKIRSTASGCGNTYTYYNDALMPIRYVDEYGSETAYTYKNNLLKTESVDGETTTYSYINAVITSSTTVDEENNVIYQCKYADGLPVKEQDEDDYTYYTYDSKGNMLICAALKEDYTGTPPESYDSSLTCFDVTSYTYDDRGRATKEEYSDGESSEYTYDNRGNVLTETVKEYENEDDTALTTMVTSYTYDDSGNILTTGTGDEKSSYVYDTAGRLVYSNENGDCTFNRYDSDGRLVQTVGPDVFDSAQYNDGTYADTNAGTRYTYNSKDQVVTEINNVGVETNYTYYSTGEKETEKFGGYEYTYNIDGQIADIVIRNGSHLTHYARYEYDDQLPTDTTGTVSSADAENDASAPENADPNLNNAKLRSVTYGNGQIVKYGYSDNGSLISQSYMENENADTVVQYQYEYDADNNLTRKLDFESSQIYNYTNDESTNTSTVSVNVMARDDDGKPVNGAFVYAYKDVSTPDNEETDDVDESVYTHTNTVGTSSVTSVSDESGERITTANGAYTISSASSENSETTVLKDSSDNALLTYNYTYTNDDITSVSVTAQNYSNTFSYQYDDKGRITNYSSSAGTSDVYQYGNKGQLLRNDHMGADKTGTTYTYSYDSRGNLLHQKEYDYTTDSLSGSEVNSDSQFTYDYDNDMWLDAVDSVGAMSDAPMYYDANGNPVELADVRYHWSNGRQLSSVTYMDENNEEQPLVSYTYDDSGIRTSKTFGDTVTYYTNIDGTITSQYQLDKDGKVTGLMQFLYDSADELIGFTYDGKTYFYVKNVQGDVTAVLDSSGTEVASYDYTAYGQPTDYVTGFAAVNPMRYRGYYYDDDFGAYYLQSRYYSPEFGRFLNSDLPEYAQVQKNDHYGTNLFAYCCNDPVNNADYDGRLRKLTKVPKSKKVGWGIQIELSAAFAITSFTVGVELIWYKSKYHRGDKKIPVLYLYWSGNIALAGGQSKVSDKVDKKLKQLFKKRPKNFKDIINAFDFSVSISAFRVCGFKKSKYGFKKFNSYKDYLGPFDVVSGSIFHIKFFAAVGDTCYVYGAGIDSSKLGASWGKSNYILGCKLKVKLGKLKKFVKKKL